MSKRFFPKRRSVTNGQWMTFFVCLLVLVQMALIVDVLVMVNKGCLSTSTDRQIVGESSAIMLSLITFCVTLAVVIPYVIGKSITQNDIRNVVLEHNKQYDHKIDETVKGLEWSEAHLSRMIAYLLLHQQERRPDWAIGWASKSLIRYLKQDFSRPWVTDFCDDCVQYILNGIKLIGNETSNSDDKCMLRAIKDAYDASGMISHSKMYRADIDDRNSLKEGIRNMCRMLVSKGTYTEQKIINEIARASHYKLYLGDNATDRDFAEQFRSDILE